MKLFCALIWPSLFLAGCGMTKCHAKINNFSGPKTVSVGESISLVATGTTTECYALGEPTDEGSGEYREIGLNFESYEVSLSPESCGIVELDGNLRFTGNTVGVCTVTLMEKNFRRERSYISITVTE